MTYEPEDFSVKEDIIEVFEADRKDKSGHSRPDNDDYANINEAMTMIRMGCEDKEFVDHVISEFKEAGYDVKPETIDGNTKLNIFRNGELIDDICWPDAAIFEDHMEKE